MSPRRITLSTSGIPKLIKKMADDEVQFNLAVSLHSAIQETREKIMPFAVKFPLMNFLLHCNTGMKKQGKIVTFEYVVLEGINDDMAHIRALVDYCKKVPSKVNLIEYNAIGERLQQAAPAVIDRYIEYLGAAHTLRCIALEERYRCSLGNWLRKSKTLRGRI